jgi:peptidoglycan/xylan/chitin deacetylase (PgdA/CDA1 family)
VKRLIRGNWGGLRRLGSFLLLPLSTLPLFGAVPAVVNSHRSYVRYYQSPPLAAPGEVLTAAERATFPPLPAYTGAVPVLAYHGINGDDDGYSVSQRTFAAQMEMLKLAGFQTISIAQYNAFQHGDSAGLPARPILVTFDDGRFDSYRGADKILERDGFRATMFVITGDIASRNPFYLNWTELHRMNATGRWDIQPHAYEGHTQIVVDAKGDEAPFYAMRRWLRSTGEESYADFQRRVGEDLFQLADQFHSQGIPVYSIAAPFGDYGQRDAGNDPRVPLYDLGVMQGQFGTVFVQDDANDPDYTTPTGAGPQKRWEAHTRSTAMQLYAWLRRHDPAEPGFHAAAPSAAVTSTSNHTE